MVNFSPSCCFSKNASKPWSLTLKRHFDILSFNSYGFLIFLSFLTCQDNYDALAFIICVRVRTVVSCNSLYKIWFNSVTQSCPTLCNPMDWSMPGLSVHHQFPEPTQTHVHWVGDAIQPPHPLSSPSPPAFNLSQHQGLFKWVSSSHQVAKVLELQLQHQSFQGIFRTNFL